MRDLDKNPYSKDEKRVAEFFAKAGTGGGDDPIRSILVSHAYLATERNELRKALVKARRQIHDVAVMPTDTSWIDEALKRF